MKINTTLISSNTSDTSSASWYHDFFYEKADYRIRDKWLMGDPFQIVAIYTFYVIFIVYILPWIMKDKKPVNIDRYAVMLNISIFLTCVYFVAEGIPYWFFQFSWRCQPIDRTESYIGLKSVRICYYFLLSKFLYIFESVLFGLRKNYSSTATYMLIHHFSYPIAVWVVSNYFPGGHVTFVGFVNAFTHMLLFGFRILFVNLFPKTRLYHYRRPIGLWLFIFQFAAIFIHAFQLLIWNDCGFPIAYAYFTVIYVTMITVLLVVMVVPQL